LTRLTRVVTLALLRSGGGTGDSLNSMRSRRVTDGGDGDNNERVLRKTARAILPLLLYVTRNAVRVTPRS